MASVLSDLDWVQLLKRIKDGNCTPFLGAGVNFGILPLGKQISEAWASSHEYPLDDSYDLARVSQYLALTGPDRVYPKSLIQEEFERTYKSLAASGTFPDFNAAGHPLGVLAELPLPIYITTNYDDFMFRALRAKGKDPKVELCIWNQALLDRGAVVYTEPTSGKADPASVRIKEFGPSLLAASSNFDPTPRTPVVYHLHGHYKLIESMVLTENDYLDFLVNMSKDQKLLPTRIKYSLTATSLLFMGYSLADPNFRVLFRGLIYPMAEYRRLSISIQLPPSERAQGYLTKYFDDMKFKVYWSKAEDFVSELLERWTKFNSAEQ
jgi:hypothetical protein